MVMLSWILLTTAVVSFSVDGIYAIIAKTATKGDSSSNSSEVTFTTEEPLRRQTHIDKSGGGRSAENSGQLDAEESVKRQAVYSGHHYPELHHNELSYGGGYGYGAEEGNYHHLPPHHHYHGHHDHAHGHYYHHHHDYAHQALAVKGLLIPLAGIALLGAAAAFVSNPILLQLGVITGKRRRRSTPALGPQEAEAIQQQLNDLVLLERFIAQLPKDQAVAQEKQLLATYLSCSGSALANGTMCLERVTCEIHRPDSVASQLEKHVMNIVTAEIFKNEYVPEQVKMKVRNAAARGSQTGDCTDFPCKDLEVEK